MAFAAPLLGGLASFGSAAAGLTGLASLFKRQPKAAQPAHLPDEQGNALKARMAAFRDRIGGLKGKGSSVLNSALGVSGAAPVRRSVLG